jgi:acyl-coenzyme A thioesterase PaaI-like protein
VSETLERRARVAERLRELGHEFVAREVPDAELDALEADVSRLVERVRATEARRPKISTGAAALSAFVARREGDVEGFRLLADSLVAGQANPLGLGAVVGRADGVATMAVTLGKAFEGPPGRSHGGVVAALVDEAMGMAMGMEGILAMTARLTLAYLGPTPIERPIVARAWLAERDGRKLTLRAEVLDGEDVVVEAEGLFIAIDPDRLADPAP